MICEIDRGSNGKFLVSGSFEVFPSDSAGYYWAALGQNLVRKSKRLNGYRLIPPSPPYAIGRIEFNFHFEMDATEPIKNLEDKLREIQKKAQEDFTREIDALLALKDYFDVLREGESK